MCILKYTILKCMYIHYKKKIVNAAFRRHVCLLLFFL